MAYRVSFGASAADDLIHIYDWVWREAGGQMAQEHAARIEAACLALAQFPERGSDRSDIWPGLRTIPYRRSATIAYLVEGKTVRIIRILHRGRELSVSEADI